MSETGENQDQEIKEASMQRHYDIATNPDIVNKDVKAASAEALLRLGKDAGKENFMGFLRRAMGLEKKKVSEGVEAKKG